ncbi:uncharacterized protein IL334_001082 [Kwoniella shivajii]|uniref:RNase III domain-containing protein n=1 Tax=Kwoniella shivajii TaxID=564305 RepID=A0ABZ1CRJ4_9TREE|nr:hypothetical protein IL334_001082 [Kwoniella shivajii]
MNIDQCSISSTTSTLVENSNPVPTSSKKKRKHREVVKEEVAYEQDEIRREIPPHLTRLQSTPLSSVYNAAITVNQISSLETDQGEEEVYPILSALKRRRRKQSKEGKDRLEEGDQSKAVLIPQTDIPYSINGETSSSLSSSPGARKIHQDGSEVEPIIINDPMISSSSPNETERYTTPNGTLLTFQNAGTYLTHWTQSIGQQKLLVEYKNILTEDYQPPMIPSKTALKRKIYSDSERREGEITPEKEEKGKVDVGPPIGSLRECEITLPMIGVIRSTKPLPNGGWRNKQLAKQSASFQSIKELHQRGLLDDSLRPIPEPKAKSIPTNNQDPSTLSSGAVHEKKSLKETQMTSKSKSCQNWDLQKRLIHSRLPPSPSENNLTPTGQLGIGNYPYVSTPSFWSSCPQLAPNVIHATTLQLLSISSPTLSLADNPAQREETCRTMCLLTSKPLPVSSQELVLNFGNQAEIKAKMKITNHGKMKSWEQGKLDHVLKFTEKLLRAQMQKPFKGNLKDLKWLIVPLKLDHQSKASDSKKLQRRDISWEEISSIAKGPLFTPFNLADPDILHKQCQDGVITTPAEFAKRNYIKSVRTDLKPSSSHPLLPDKTILATINPLSSLDYPDQPILEVESVLSPKYGGHVIGTIFPSRSEKSYHIPELVKLHSIPASVFRTTSILPQFFNELDSLLIATQMNNDLFDRLLDPKLALQAITTSSSNYDIESHYERLEFIGDTILKLIVTIHSYVNDTEMGKNLEQSFQDRHVTTSNRSLQDNAIKVGLTRYIRSKRFKAKDWLPKDWAVDWNENGAPGGNSSITKISSDTIEGEHDLGDKVLADVLEALIGASYLASRDLDEVLSVAHVLGIPIKGLQKWSDLSYALPPPTTTQSTKEANYMNFFKSKENTILGYEFKDESKINQVLSLDMTVPGRKMTFDRYRMLGNAILDYLVVEYLFDNYPEEGPAPLTFMKASRCTEGVRSALSVELGLVDLLRDSDDQTRVQIAKIRKATKAAKTKADALNSENDINEVVASEWWLDVAVTHTTSDPLEALIGAITHDASFDLSPIRIIFSKHISPFLERYCSPPRKQSSHPKDEMIRYLASKGCSHYSVERVFHDDSEEAIVNIHDKEISRASVVSGMGVIAIKKACEIALNLLKAVNSNGIGLEGMCTCPGRKIDIVKKSGI